MTSTTLQVVLQAFSTLAVAGGLIYAALQLREWRNTQYVANFTTLVALLGTLRKMVVDDPTLAPIGLAVPAKDPEEIRRFFYNLIELSLFEIAWFSHKHRQLPDDYFASWVEQISAISARPAFQDMWYSDRTKIQHEGFRQYMDELMRHSRATESVMRPNHLSSGSRVSSQARSSHGQNH